MIPREDHLAQAERHVREGEERVAKLQAIVDALDPSDTSPLARGAREALKTMQETLALRREHLCIEQQARGLEP